MPDFNFMPLATDAWLADTSHLTESEVGAYLKLLLLSWRTPGCRIPADAAWHMHKLGVESNKYNDLYKQLISEFFTSDPLDKGFLIQKRQRHEFDRLVTQREQQTKKANLRWNKDSDPHSGNAAPGNAPSPSPTEEDTEATHARGEEKLPPKPIGAPPSFQIFFSAFPDQRRGSKAQAAEAYIRALDRTTEGKIHEGLKRYAISRDVAEGFAKSARNWLDEDGWANAWPPHAPAHRTDASGQRTSGQHNARTGSVVEAGLRAAAHFRKKVE